MTKEQERIIEMAALKTYGRESQVDMMIEEMSELTKALFKIRRGESNGAYFRYHGNVCEELADVEIMVEQMKILYGEKSVAEWKEAKLKRLATRLKMDVKESGK